MQNGMKAPVGCDPGAAGERGTSGFAGVFCTGAAAGVMPEFEEELVADAVFASLPPFSADSAGWDTAFSGADTVRGAETDFAG